MSFNENYEYEVSGCGLKRAYQHCHYELFIPIPRQCKSEELTSAKN